MRSKRKGNLVMILGICAVFFSVLALVLHLFPDHQYVVTVFFLLGLALLYLGSRIKRRRGS